MISLVSTRQFSFLLATLLQCSYCAVRFDDVSAERQEQEQGTIWPKPQREERNTAVSYTFQPEDFNFHLSRPTDELLRHACQRYMELIFSDKYLNAANDLDKVTSLLIVVDNFDQPLGSTMDESYEMRVVAPKSVLKAQSRWGALRGLETFSQLVFRQNNSYVAYSNKIVDFPRFPYRGFLIDTSRHYLPIPTIFKFLDAMSYNKFNLLHWHIVDDPSFPFVSKSFPALHTHGSYNNKTHIYTPAMVKRVIEYARRRGIRVMPEFDTPGHTFSWRGVQGLLVDCNSSYDSPNDHFDRRGTINPLRENTYELLKRFFAEVAETFPDSFLHLGGDEVDYRCWLNSTEIKTWFARYNITPSGPYLQRYYLNRLMKIVERLKKDAVVWQEVFDDGVTFGKSTIVNVWKPATWREELSKVTAKGYTAILSSCWYLDYHGYGYDWFQHYECDPHNFTGTDKQMALVLGGTAAIWGEFVDATNVISRSFGRGFAVAERLWSSKDTNDVREALPRIWEQQCRHVRRGIPAEPVAKNRYCTYEWDSTKHKRYNVP